MFVHGYGNTFSGNATAAQVVGPQVRGEWANRQLAELRLRLYARMGHLAETDGQAAERLERFIYSAHHCGDVPAEW